MELVFEIGCEDLPARFVEPALKQLEDHFRAACEEQRISAEGVRVVGTPRRLVLLVEELAERQADLEEERTGPPAKVAFRDGAPTKAAEGFARGQGVEVGDLYTVETEKGEYVAAKVFEEGKAVGELLPAILEAMIEGLSFPKSMRWASHSESFARPVRWIVAVAGGEVVPLAFASVESGRTSTGHRFAAAEASFEVDSIASYLDGLADAHVVVDPAERRERIAAALADAAERAGGVLVHDDALLDEVTQLVEEPHVVLVEYSDDYLELPDEVLISSMRSHQRYFAISQDGGHGEGKLMSACGVVYNTPVRDPDVVRAGNLRVLKARLDDARFFWEQDLKQPLADSLERLDRVVWLQKIGSVRGRTTRISELAARIAQAMGLDDEHVGYARRAGELSKADLVSNMVYEFPDLQGVMGREYARHSGEPEAVAQAIYEQYLPRGAEDDELPQTDVGAAVALAEKIEAMVGCFGVGLIPTSAADPYALRRSSIGVLRILQSGGYPLGLPHLVEMAWGVYEECDPQALNAGEEELSEQLLDFFRTRLKNQLAATYPADVVEAVLAVGLDDVVSVADRVAALDALRSEADFEPLAQGFKRVVNILRKQAGDYDAEALTVDPARFEEDAERDLHAAYLEASEILDSALAERDWEHAMRTLIGLKAPVDAFFDGVMVMADDAELRRNRLALLFELQGLFLRVADLSQIS